MRKDVSRVFPALDMLHFLKMEERPAGKSTSTPHHGPQHSKQGGQQPKVRNGLLRTAKVDIFNVDRSSERWLNVVTVKTLRNLLKFSQKTSIFIYFY